MIPFVQLIQFRVDGLGLERFSSTSTYMCTCASETIARKGFYELLNLCFFIRKCLDHQSVLQWSKIRFVKGQMNIAVALKFQTSSKMFFLF